MYSAGSGLSISSLPLELISHIIEAVVDDIQNNHRKRRAALYDVARANRSFYLQTRPLLFEDIFIYGRASAAKWPKQIRLLHLLASDARLASFVKVLGLQFEFAYVEDDPEGDVQAAPNFLGALYKLMAKATRHMTNLRMYDGDQFSFIWNHSPCDSLVYVHVHEYLRWSPHIDAWFASRPSIKQLYIEPHPKRGSLLPTELIWPSHHPSPCILPKLNRLEGYLTTAALDILAELCRGRPIKHLLLSGPDARPWVLDLRALADLIGTIATNEQCNLRSLIIDNIGHDFLPSSLLRPFLSPIYRLDSPDPLSVTRSLEELHIDVSHSIEGDLEGPHDLRWDPELMRLLRSGACSALRFLVLEMGFGSPCSIEKAASAEPLRLALLDGLRSPRSSTSSSPASSLDMSPSPSPSSSQTSSFSTPSTDSTPPIVPRTAGDVTSSQFSDIVIKPPLDLLTALPALEKVRVPHAWLLLRSKCSEGHVNWVTVTLARQVSEEAKLDLGALSTVGDSGMEVDVMSD